MIEEGSLEDFLIENLGFCGCGSPSEAADFLMHVLECFPIYEHKEKLIELIPDSGARLFCLYMTGHLGLSEHGTSINGAWLTDEGKQVLAKLINQA